MAESGASTSQRRPRMLASRQRKTPSGPEQISKILIGLSKNCSCPIRIKQRKKWLKLAKKGFAAEYADKEERRAQEKVKRIYAAVFDEPMPYSPLFCVAGYCDHYTKDVLFSTEYANNPSELELICHELLHVRRPMMVHGKKFNKKVREMLKVAKGVK